MVLSFNGEFESPMSHYGDGGNPLFIRISTVFLFQKGGWIGVEYPKVPILSAFQSLFVQLQKNNKSYK